MEQDTAEPAASAEEGSAQQQPKLPAEPSLEPYVGRLERFDLFSTNQCYYLIGSNELNTAYRIIKIDRTLIERAPETDQGYSREGDAYTSRSSPANRASKLQDNESGSVRPTMAENHHTSKPTLRPLSEFLTEDPNVYTREEFNDLFDMIQDGNRVTQAGGTPGMVSQGRGGGLKSIVKAYGIVGFVRFLDCYYLTLITKRARVGSIGGNGVYTIKNTETIPLKPAERSPSDPEELDPSSVLLSMWNRGKRSVGLGLTNREINEIRYQGLYQVVDLSKSFFFSYTYDLTRSLQENFLATTTKTFPPPPLKDNFAWNYFLTREFEGCLHSLTSYQWIIPIIHGAVVQRKVNDYGRSLNLVLIARRSRHFAGTRYLKRGVNEQGRVANEVEHEQIVHDESKFTSTGVFSSYLQIRGSIPTFWAQEGSMTMPKPPIELNRVDLTYTATRLHFEDLFKRYSSPVLALDLVKQSEKREREVRVGNEYRRAVDFINNTINDERHKIRYCALDFSHINKHRNLDVNASLNEVSAWAVTQTGFFCSSPKWKVVTGGIIEPFAESDGCFASQLSGELGVPVFPMEQRGVLRTNCIDCLDRTNDTQLRVGVEALSQQLVVMGIRSRERLEPSSTLVRVLSEMYSDIGDSVALQYGGSEAHKKVTVDRSESNMALGKHKELFTSIKRYYSNTFTDRLKQDAMNLFLGYYLPYCHTIPLWELETDYHLHNFHTKTGRGTNYSMGMYRSAYGLSLPGNGKTQQKKGRITVENEVGRVAKVRNMCMDQHDSLSTWWQLALQSHIQQRMWMKLGPSQQDSLLPSRYERLYQPHKIAQFDRFFMRSWVTPVRRDPTEQIEQAPSDGVGLKRAVSSKVKEVWIPSKNEAEPKPESTLLRSYVSEYGFESRHEPQLKRCLAHHDRRLLVSDSSDNYTFLSEVKGAQVNAEYANYVAPLHEVYDSPGNCRPAALNEFKDYLQPYSLTSDDVSGIKQLSESAYLGRTIQSGPYRGLDHNESAVEVATVIHEQFNALESFTSSAYSLIEDELARRGLYSEGVKETVASDWTSLNQAEKQYEEVMSDRNIPCRRSDLTTPSSMRIYTSAVDDEALTAAEMILVRGKPPRNEVDNAVHDKSVQGRTGSFVKKANRLGIRVSEYRKPTAPSLFPSSRRGTVRPGFEQINNDMYCWKRNKFVVFNGAGAKSWREGRAVTKLSSAEDALDTLSALKQELS